MAQEVKRHPITKGIMAFVLLVCLGFLLSPRGVMAVCSNDTPTIINSSGFFWGAAVVEGVPVSNGDIVRAYVDTVIGNNGCVGIFTVNTPGSYGSISVYADDISSLEKDGVVNGDTIRFKICHAGVEYTCTQTYTWSSANVDEFVQIDLTAVPTTLRADFSASPTSGCALTVQFTNNSTGATSYSWNFGDSSPVSTTASPSHTYSAGTYTVTLTARNGSVDTKTKVITVGPPVAAFTASPMSIATSFVVTFTNSSTGAASYVWNFGDGQTSTTDLLSVPHQYTAAGIYTVILTATNACGNKVETKTNLITVTDPAAPAITFTATPTAGNPRAVQFNNSVFSGAGSYLWNFGNGVTSTDPNPLYTYPPSNITNYTVTLTVRDAGGNLLPAKTMNINVAAATPVPLFDEMGKILLFFSLITLFCCGVTKQRKMS